jgi:hypothetical protein
MLRVVLIVAAVSLFLLAGIVPAYAQITLRFSPPDTTIMPASVGRLSVMLDDAIDIRSINIVVTYDTTIVKSIAGEVGALYTDSGFFTFQGFEEDTLGEWNGYAVLMGSGLAIYGPGELFWWDFETLAEGVTPVISLAADISDINGDWYADVSLDSTTIIVGDPLSGVHDVPDLRGDLRLYPNPFNPRTEIFFDLDRSGWVELAVYDVRGHQVMVLHDGTAQAGQFKSSWNGLDSSGLAQPGGVYLFRMSTPAGRSVTKGVLLK